MTWDDHTRHRYITRSWVSRALARRRVTRRGNVLRTGNPFGRTRTRGGAVAGRERIDGAGVPARACAHRDEPIDARFERLLRMPDLDDVMEDDPAVVVDAGHERRRRRKRGDHDRHPVREHNFEIRIEPLVRLVHDEIHRERWHSASRILIPEAGELALDAREPPIELVLRPRVERRKRADDAGLALLDHEIGPGDEEHRRAEYRDAQGVANMGGQRHADFFGQSPLYITCARTRFIVVFAAP